MATRKPSAKRQSHELDPIVRLWILRILVPLGGHRQFLQRHCFTDDGIAEQLGFGAWLDSDETEFNPRKVLPALRQAHRAAERTCWSVGLPSQLARNIDQIAGLVGLNEAETKILGFAALIHNERMLDDAGDWLGQLSTLRVFHALSVLLDLPEAKVSAAMSPNGALARSGLVMIERGGSLHLRAKLNLLSDSFADCLYSSESDPVGLLRDTVAPSEPPELGLDDYRHLSTILAMLIPYLRQSIESRRKGVNILIHGTPGTGKTQLARLLAAELGSQLFEVTTEDTDGDAVVGGRRLRALRAAQSLLARQRAMILFDETEDVLQESWDVFGGVSKNKCHKAWINRTLEEGAVPTLWLTNSIRGVDPAFLRRFDMIFELPVPPQSVRADILRKAARDVLDERTIACASEHSELAPAVVTRVATVVQTIRDDLEDIDASDAFELLVSNTLESQGHRRLRRNDPNRLPDFYDPALINTDDDLSRLADGLARAKGGRLCLYGPPGTGKTAYGRWLAARLEVPIVVKRASDLLSMWVGETEKNIARAFRDAEGEKALLLIDEVDGFLRDRRSAERSWEASQVNEMLTQIEGFGGIFVATTNLIDGLDQAALRRFDIKLKFDYLRPEQASTLLAGCCEFLSLPQPDESATCSVRSMRNLTPGDFAVVLRQNRFHPIDSADAIMTALAEESTLKEDRGASIGFVRGA